MNAVKEVIALYNPRSPITESYRMLRTNIQYSSLDKPIKTIVVTSTGPSEGKTVTCANLAVVMAQAGSKVLVIDADLRRPAIHKVFGVSNKVGLTNLLVENKNFEEIVQKDGVEGLDLITSGPIPPNPAELLGSKKFENFLNTISQSYDYIIIDTPPCGSLTDAAIIGRIVDGVILVAAAGEVQIEAIQQAKENLQKVNANIIGVVLNKVKRQTSSYYYYYYYYYYYQDENGEVVKKKKTGRRRKKDDRYTLPSDGGR
ncbi:capsular exopolysaccharide family [Caldicellulosiruptor kronotskyensis 2002]|uniref:non-specific protein-tyrosine kinase n=1 Tax=Caldicellulosiruptor kronotskyensis (strain DSM 18902 / VKM B-2412 / 2002) TaxID=632348 RepID=E4SDX4_CALK2|nr:CpsD/CapB family tyrosine-protein kinase [Caldicellulosiruptor kronotskyensis]ADQ45261.1 capsular exopolysaccharide family [Caldicellulosiruptor kronotskyensis 2002]